MAPAVAMITLRGEGTTWEIAVCATHLAVLEAELDEWGSTG